MALVSEIRKRVRKVAPPVVAACLVAYFAYHAVHGGRGLPAWTRLKADLAEAKATEMRLAAERATLERRIGLLRSDHLDPDLLEEQARRLLNYGRADEVIILLPKRPDTGR